MVARALWKSEALRVVPWLRPWTRLRLVQVRRPRHNPVCPWPPQCTKTTKITKYLSYTKPSKDTQICNADRKIRDGEIDWRKASSNREIMVKYAFPHHPFNPKYIVRTPVQSNVMVDPITTKYVREAILNTRRSHEAIETQGQSQYKNSALPVYKFPS